MYENILMDKLNNKVRINKNKIEIYFNGVNDLEELFEKMNIKFEDE